MNEIPLTLAPVAGAHTAAPGAPGAAPAGAVDFELLLAAALAVSDAATGIPPEPAALVGAQPQPSEEPAPAQTAAPAGGLEIAALSAAAAAAQALVPQPLAAEPQADTPQSAPQRTPLPLAAPGAATLGAFEAETAPAEQSAASPHALAVQLPADGAAPGVQRETAAPQPAEAMSARARARTVSRRCAAGARADRGRAARRSGCAGARAGGSCRERAASPRNARVR
ncbi:MAG: hypothetical protein RML56_02140 [Burkholderiales bacterium]|nr:hypothetical protein [Burkholderiales bacterium]